MATSVEDLGKYVEGLFAGPLLPKLTKPVVHIRSLHQFPLKADEPEGEQARRAGLAYGLGWVGAY